MDRDKQKQLERRQKAIRWVEKEIYCPFVHINDVNLVSQPILLANRVSTRKQQKDLPPQILFNYQTAKKAGAKIVGCITSIAKGYDTETHQKVADLAIEKGAKAILWETTCRAIRHSDWGRHNLLAQPTEEELTTFAKRFSDIQLVTALSPPLSFIEVRTHQISRGLNNNPFSRNTKGSTLRNKLWWQAATMRLNDLSYGQIAKELGEERVLIQKWLQPYFSY